jgi:hypothetical protein
VWALRWALRAGRGGSSWLTLASPIRCACFLLFEAIRPHTPVSNDRQDGHEGGALRDGLKGKAENIQNGVRLAMTSDQKYAEFVIHGTRPHTIEMRSARALRFWAEGDSIRFAKSVHHPGTQPNPFYHDADDEIRHIVRTDVKTAVLGALHS